MSDNSEVFLKFLFQSYLCVLNPFSSPMFSHRKLKLLSVCPRLLIRATYWLHLNETATGFFIFLSSTNEAYCFHKLNIHTNRFFIENLFCFRLCTKCCKRKSQECATSKTNTCCLHLFYCFILPDKWYFIVDRKVPHRLDIRLLFCFVVLID